MVSFQRKVQVYWRENSQKVILVVSLLLLLMFTFFVTNRAWVGDDSYITFRVVDNWSNGYGLRWNVDERVQVYTHPLWMFLIAFLHIFTGEVYLTSIFLSIGLSAGVGGIFFLSEKKNPAIWLGLVLLAFSSAFIDYSTSGLENPLSHFLLMLFLFRYFSLKDFQTVENKDILLLGVIAGLGCLNRLDYLLIYAPSLIYVVLKSNKKWKAVLFLIISFLPVIVWLIFAGLYYGFPLPNTFYAKLGNWLSRGELIAQGWKYLQHTFWNDPITGFTLMIGLVMNFFHRSWDRFALTLGGILYILYVLWVGGDFMEGRFLTGVFLVIVVQLVHYDLPKIKLLHYSWISLLLVFVNMYASVPTFVAQSWDFVDPWKDGVVNERYFYAYDTGLFRDGVFNTQPGHFWVGDGRDLREECHQETCLVDLYSVGFAGYYAGPNIHIIDRLGLGSALMARIPPFYTTDWRIGHFERVIPEGYKKYLNDGNIENILDPSMREYVIHLEKLTKDNIFSSQRLSEIIDFTQGKYKFLIDEEIYQYPNLIEINISDFSEPKFGLAWNDHENLLVYNSGIRIDFESDCYSSQIGMSVAQLGDFETVFYSETMEELGRMRYHIPSTSRTVETLLSVPDKIAIEGYRFIHILPRKGVVPQDGKFTVNAVFLTN